MQFYYISLKYSASTSCLMRSLCNKGQTIAIEIVLNIEILRTTKTRLVYDSCFKFGLKTKV